MSVKSLRLSAIIAALITSLLLNIGCSSSPIPVGPELPKAETEVEPTLGEPAETPAEASQTEPIVFEDAVFANLIRKELGKVEIFPLDLSPFSSISIAADEYLFLAGNGISEKSIIHFNEDSFEYEGIRYTGYGTLKSLADLKYFPNLKNLKITLQPEIDYGSFPTDILKNINTLFIYQSRLKDISFLKSGDHLTNIVLNTNEISDLTPVKDLKKILRLIVDRNQIEDLSPVSNLTTLTELSAWENKISDLSPLSGLSALEEIGFYNNQIKDLTPLRDLNSLRVVELISNDIEDVEPLSGFSSFEELRLGDNPIKNIELLSHITNLDY